MSSPRLFVELPLAIDAQLSIDGDQARYIGRVLRARAGDEVILFNGRGGEYRARIEAISKTQVQVTVLQFANGDRESPLPVRLIQGVSRGDRMDTVVQKATELGVQRISPLLSEFSVVRLDTERADKRTRHWEAVSRSACEQCGRNRPPRIDVPCRMDALLAEKDTTATRLILLPDAPQSLHALTLQPASVELLIGPEGGLSALEQERALDTGYLAVSMGPRVMRTETAAIAAITLVQSRWGDLA
ncbi:16S rRNA (uracil(1498)-N(3))-methyltransferase [Woeseia oceani]|uniref:Ribosomal RNA small subunit methyltransferase E n=1 Tax=Woeseia oceani TaxID=1548547 RepID=A0A193LD16_9GAMM|nr:16S rRNA (uracil(1498)-N(3))-methyltransferase [Woeseia oceani]ANO50368.1 16S rRNA (uracil(1498)-N(3))-methyltransferase [Woeseia oceani]